MRVAADTQWPERNAIRDYRIARFVPAHREACGCSACVRYTRAWLAARDRLRRAVRVGAKPPLV